MRGWSLRFWGVLEILEELESLGVLEVLEAIKALEVAEVLEVDGALQMVKILEVVQSSRRCLRWARALFRHKRALIPPNIGGVPG
jgi:hypothetical protein